MAYLTDDLINGGTVRSSRRAFRQQVSSGGNTGMLYVGKGRLTLALHPLSGVTAAFWEYTCTPQSAIEADDSVVRWIKWPIGDVAVADGAKADSFLGPVVAIRGTSNGGAAIFEAVQEL